MAMQAKLLTLLCLLPLGTGCVAVAAGAAAGYIIGQEVLPNDVYTATIADDVEVVWDAAKDAMRARSTEPPEVSEMPRTTTGVVEDAKVTIEVQAYDLDVTIVRVRAERFLTSRSRIAESMLDETLKRLTR